MKKCLLITGIFLLIFFQSLLGQEITLTGNVSAKEQTLANETVFLFNADSILIKTAITDEQGNFTFAVPPAIYYLQVDAATFTVYTSALFEANRETILPAIVLEKQGSELGEVEVVARKPYLERQPGKLILNVENSISATGTSAFELLGKAPAVSINSNDVISLSGKSGIAVQIDGKTLPMSGTELANYLRGIPSAAIAKIELITHPSSKYDAAGTAIINIKLKKDTRLGTNGTITGGYGQGVYAKANGGISINHRSKKYNLYGSYNYAYRKVFSHLVLDRRFFTNNVFEGAYYQDNNITFPINNHLARIGMDYNLNASNTLSIVANGTNNRLQREGFNRSDVIGPDGSITSRFETNNHTADNWYDGAVNVNYKRVLDTLGSEWTVDLDYARYGNANEQVFTTHYLNLNNEDYQQPYLLRGTISGKLAIHAIKTDYHRELGKDRSLDAGLKSSYVIADNNLQFFNESSGTAIYDSTKSNHFIYKENINALYASFTQKVGKWNYQLGLRAEYTGVSGEQLVYAARNDTTYLQLFPTAFVSYALNDNHTLEFNYNRRIDRPGYDQLNPFKFYLDPSTYREGNPYLRPQTTHNLELAYLWKQRYYTQLGILRTRNNITEVIAPSATLTNVTVQTNINLHTVDMLYGNIAVPIDITSWWNSTNNINAYIALYSGDVAKTQLQHHGNFAFNLSTNNTFTLKKNWSAEFNGSYRSKEIYAFDNIKPIWSVGAGVQKKILNNAGTVRLNITDLFFTNSIRADVAFTDYTEYFKVKNETRVATLSFSYKFGKASIPANRRRGSGVDDLKNRVNNSGGG